MLSTSSIFSAALFAGLAAAQNAFTMATIPATIHAGTPFNITWQATTPGDVSIWLVQGPASDTKYVATIAANITNEGQYSWTPASSLQSGSQYALEIVDDSNTNIVNYSGQFALDSGATSVDGSASSSADSSATTSVPDSSSTDASSTGSSTGSSTASTTGSSSGKTTMVTVTMTSTSSSSSSTSTVPATNGARRVGGVVGSLLLAFGAAIALF